MPPGQEFQRCTWSGLRILQSMSKFFPKIPRSGRTPFATVLRLGSLFNEAPNVPNYQEMQFHIAAVMKSAGFPTACTSGKSLQKQWNKACPTVTPGKVIFSFSALPWLLCLRTKSFSMRDQPLYFSIIPYPPPPPHPQLSLLPSLCLYILFLFLTYGYLFNICVSSTLSRSRFYPCSQLLYATYLFSFHSFTHFVDSINNFKYWPRHNTKPLLPNQV